MRRLVYKTTICRILKTPRDVVRLVNKVKVITYNLKKDVCFADLVAWEVLSNKYSSFHNIVYEEQLRLNYYHIPEVYTKTEISKDFENMVSDNEEKRSSVEVIMERIGIEARQKAVFEDLCCFMFPSFGAKDNDDENSEYPSRISNYNAFLTLIHKGINLFSFSSEEVRAFLSTPESRSIILEDKKLGETGHLSEWLDFVNNHIYTNDVFVIEPTELVQMFVHYGILSDIKCESNVIRIIISCFVQSNIQNTLLSKIINILPTYRLKVNLIFELLSGFNIITDNGIVSVDNVDTRHVSFECKEQTLMILESFRLKILRELSKQVKENFSFMNEIRDSSSIGLFYSWGYISGDFRIVKLYIQKLVKASETSYKELYDLYKTIDPRGDVARLDKLIYNRKDVVGEFESYDTLTAEEEKILAYHQSVIAREEKSSQPDDVGMESRENV